VLKNLPKRMPNQVKQLSGSGVRWLVRLPILSEYQVRRGGMVRGIAAEERFLYEIMLGGLVLTLTNLDEMRKIRGIPKQKKRRPASSLALKDMRSC
jgi:hypothetical protein